MMLMVHPCKFWKDTTGKDTPETADEGDGAAGCVLTE